MSLPATLAQVQRTNDRFTLNYRPPLASMPASLLHFVLELVVTIEQKAIEDPAMIRRMCGSLMLVQRWFESGKNPLPAAL